MARTPHKIPLPGQPVKGSTSGRPIMAALDLLGRRWSLRIIWELRDAPVGFREMQARCGGMSPTVLSTRLKELEAARIIAADEDRRWRLTATGQDLIKAFGPLHTWAERWAEEF